MKKITNVKETSLNILPVNISAVSVAGVFFLFYLRLPLTVSVIFARGVDARLLLLKHSGSSIDDCPNNGQKKSHDASVKNGNFTHRVSLSFDFKHFKA